MKGKVLHTSATYLYFSIGLTIYRQSIETGAVEVFIKLPSPLTKSLVARFDLSSRLLRAQVHHMIEDGSGGYYVIYLNKLVRISASGEINGEVQSLVGSRPLCICVYKDKLVFGEYTNNASRKRVGLYSFDGKTLEMFCPVDGVRHIHGVFFDHFDRQLYVTTGDYEEEAGIWKFDEGTGMLNPVLVGGQQSRAVQLLFDEQAIYFGTDTPLEQNYLYKLDKRTRELVSISKVSSSVFYGTKWNDSFVFATVIEPSDVNLTKEVEIWNLDGGKVKLLKKHKKDFWSMKYFQYGQITFPTNSIKSPSPDFWYSTLATKKSGFSHVLKAD